MIENKVLSEALKEEEAQKLPLGLEKHRYRRYHLETKPAPDVAPSPSHFRVRVKKHRLALMLLKELLHYRANKKVILSRPCVYGVFSGPIGGFAPREHLCVGCLRCTTEYPGVVQIYHNPDRQCLGDSYFTSEYFEAISYEAQTGRIPVKGAGYRGKFGGEGWDGMWTDMSQIVRPTRDGIHGREFISTLVDIGEKPAFLTFDERSLPDGDLPRVISIPLPILFDVPPSSAASQKVLTILGQAAAEAETIAIMPRKAIQELGIGGRQIAPLIYPEDLEPLRNLPFQPSMIELGTWDEKLYQEVRSRYPSSIISLRVSFRPGSDRELLARYESGVRVFHLVANYHGRGLDGRFVLDLIREAHDTFVSARRRDEVTLLGSGGIIAAEHVAKAILCGLDAVALETPLLVALQARMIGQCVDRTTSRLEVPDITVEWGVQRITNLVASLRDQLLEVMGAMGLREVRRLRGEIGRAMFHKDLEKEAFGEITGYANIQKS